VKDVFSTHRTLTISLTTGVERQLARLSWALAAYAEARADVEEAMAHLQDCARLLAPDPDGTIYTTSCNYTTIYVTISITI